MLKDNELLAAIEQERQRAQGGDYSDTDLADFRQKAWDYYLCRRNQQIPALAEYDGVSNVKDSTVHDAINGVLAAVMPSFTSDCPAQFEPAGPQDEDQAELESQVVGKVLMDDNSGYTVLYQAIKSALLLKNGIVKVWCEERTEAETEAYDNVGADDVGLFAGEGIDVDYNERERTVTVTRQRQIRELLIQPVDNTRISWRAGWPMQTLDNCPFVEEVCEYTRAELIGLGYSKRLVMELPSRSELGTQSASPRLNQSEPSGDAAIRINDIIQIFRTYMVMDDGERWYVCSAGQTVLEKMRCEFLPYAAGTAVMRLHEFSGESLSEKLMEVQNTKTGLLRALHDNLNTNNHARFIYGPGVDAQDLADSGPGRHVRSSHGPDMVVPVPIIDTSAGALSALAYQDQVTSRRVGAVLELQSGESQLLSSQIGSMGADRVLSEQEMIAALMTRTLGETLIRSLFLLIHKTLRRHYRLPITVKRGGQWQQVNPVQWPARTRLNIKTGMSAGERNRKVTNLGFLLQVQMQLMQSGSPMANPGTVHKLLMDWSRAAEIDGGDNYFTDPASPEYQQAAQQMQASQQQMQQLQLQLQTLPEQIKMQIAQMDDRREREIAQLKAELEEAKLTMEGIDNAQQREIDAAQLAVTARTADQRAAGNTGRTAD